MVSKNKQKIKHNNTSDIDDDSSFYINHKLERKIESDLNEVWYDPSIIEQHPFYPYVRRALVCMPYIRK